jgi:uncharacterized protein
MGRSEMLQKLQPDLFANDRFGVITVRDILSELKKPGRDPRPGFKAARLNDGVQDISDLKVGMVLEGTVSNVAAFGAFVDLGVHQDGLVHVSQLSNKFVKDAREIVKIGAIVTVRVVELDLARKRIALSLRLDAPAQSPGQSMTPRRDAAGASAAQRRPASAEPPAATAMASAFAKFSR